MLGTQRRRPLNERPSSFQCGDNGTTTALSLAFSRAYWPWIAFKPG